MLRLASSTFRTAAARRVTAVIGCLFVLTPGTAHAATLFEDDFAGSSLSATNWSTGNATTGQRWCSSTVANHLSAPGNWQDPRTTPCNGVLEGNPTYGSLTVTAGEAALANGNARTFPWFVTAASPFPAVGDFVVDVRMRFTQLGSHGTALAVLDWPSTATSGNNPPGGQPVFSIQADSSGGLRVNLLGATGASVASPLVAHDYRLVYSGGAYSVHVDNVLTLGPVASTRRPNAAWVGNPVFTHWSPAEWTDLALDHVRVTDGSTGDTESPQLTVPDTMTVSATSPSGAQVDYSVTASDNADPDPSVECDPPSGSTLPIGTTTVSCTATDDAGNTTTKTFDVVVEEPRDSDGDGLYDVIEIWLGCDPHDADSDDDGIGDRIEVLLGTSPTRFDSDPDDDQPNDGSYLLKVYGQQCGCGPDDDPDGDGVVTWVELKYGTNPGDPDSDKSSGGFSSDVDYIWHLCGCKPVDEDGDGIPSMVEKFYGGGSALEIIRRCGCTPWKDPRGGGGGIWVDFRFVGGPYDEPDDPDGDGIDTVIELWLGCDPHDDDSDGDGLTDPRELELGTDPTKEDTDGDGLNDKREIELGCDPLDPDSDDDGVPDGQDNCPTTPNPDQSDSDRDGKGDACDSDRDGDGVPNTSDNCADTPNADQADSDRDGVGDACETNLPGRMIGGGAFVTSDGQRVTHGFELNCNSARQPNTLQVNWDGNRFRLESVTRALCGDDRAVPNARNALFDSYTGSGTGRYNDVAGATASWTFVDAGEPGGNDRVRITIKDPVGTTVLDATGNLVEGNHQALHERQ